MNEKPNIIRIFRVEYGRTRRGLRGRFLPGRATTYIKAPYGGLFGLSETLTRAVSTGQIGWFKLAAVRPREITPEIRSQLARWPDALTATSEVTAVQWTQ